MLWYRELAGYLDAYATQHMMLTMTSNPGNEWWKCVHCKTISKIPEFCQISASEQLWTCTTNLWLSEGHTCICSLSTGDRTDSSNFRLPPFNSPTISSFLSFLLCPPFCNCSVFVFLRKPWGIAFCCSKFTWEASDMNRTTLFVPVTRTLSHLHG